MRFPSPFRLRCPRCRRVFARSLSVVRLGSGTHTCLYCGHTFADGSIEWPTAALSIKIDYLLPRIVRVYLVVGFLVETLLALSALPYWNDVRFLEIFGASLVLMPLLIYWVRCSFEIRRSTARYEMQLLTRAGYGPATREVVRPR